MGFLSGLFNGLGDAIGGVGRGLDDAAHLDFKGIDDDVHAFNGGIDDAVNGSIGWSNLAKFTPAAPLAYAYDATQALKNKNPFALAMSLYGGGSSVGGFDGFGGGGDVGGGSGGTGNGLSVNSPGTAGNGLYNTPSGGSGLYNTSLPSAPTSSFPSIPSSVSNFNLADTLGISNPTTQGIVNQSALGAGKGALTSLLGGGNVGQGALSGAVTGGGGKALGAGINNMTNGFSFQPPGSQTSNDLGDLIGGGLIGLYNGQRAKSNIQGQINNLNGLYSPDSAYAQQLQTQLSRQDAAAGRRSQYGPRSVELQAKLAQMASQQAPTLAGLYSQKNAYNNGEMRDVYNVLTKSGLLNKLGNQGQQYYQQMMGGQGQPSPVSLGNIFEGSGGDYA